MKLFKNVLAASGLAIAVLGLAVAQDHIDQARFDFRVRTDFFAGFAGNEQALARAMKICEEDLAKNPNHAEALVWHGSGVFFQSVTAARSLPNPAMARPLVETGLGDFEHTLEIQKPFFDTLGAHPRGELLIGLADGYARLGKEEQAKTYFERIRAALPGTPYAASADKWLATKSLTPREGGCLGCHLSK